MLTIHNTTTQFDKFHTKQLYICYMFDFDKQIWVIVALNCVFPITIIYFPGDIIEIFKLKTPIQSFLSAYSLSPIHTTRSRAWEDRAPGFLSITIVTPGAALFTELLAFSSIHRITHPLEVGTQLRQIKHNCAGSKKKKESI